MNLIEVKNLSKTYQIPRFLKSPRPLNALVNVNLFIKPGETLAVVGESGCGKSTLAKVLMTIEPITSGEVTVEGKDLNSYSRYDLSSQVQMIFQDPYSSLNPRKKVATIIGEPLVVTGKYSKEEIEARVIEVMQKVGLRPEFRNRYPHMFSGGQRQRIGIARALITRPKLIICDEPVSALDVSVQAQVLNLLKDLQKQEGLSYLFISHDLSVVRFISHRVAVMYLGKVVELADKNEIFKNPQHPYTKLLLTSTPKISFDPHNKRLPQVASELPSPLNPPSGCPFHTRCPIAQESCKTKVPQLRPLHGSLVACDIIS